MKLATGVVLVADDGPDVGDGKGRRSSRAAAVADKCGEHTDHPAQCRAPASSTRIHSVAN